MATATEHKPSAAFAFTVYGKPEPQGSTKAYIPKGWTRAIITSDNPRLKPWRQQVSLTALAHRSKAHGVPFAAPLAGPIHISAQFYFSRPKSAPRRVTAKLTRPDVDKCLRALLDGLSGILYRDDSQVVSIYAAKSFGTPERAEIEVGLHV